MTRIKICGITRIEDALAAARLGAHAIGLAFYAGSPRCISLPKALEIVQALPPFVTPVALFANPTPAQVQNVLTTLPVGLLQFHGDEDEAFCSQFSFPYIKAIRVGQSTDLVQCAVDFRSAKALLLDAQVAGSFGGTGKTFDWRLVPASLDLPIILSGGLNAQNVAPALQSVKPWAVDVSSGVESAKGIKDVRKIAAFIHEVRSLDNADV